jgi:hydrogenase maturation protein HypF
MAGRRRFRLQVRGAVQGVGFRPFVYRQSTALGLTGWVGNTPAGVTVEAEGEPDQVAALIRSLREAPPPNAAIVAIDSEEIAPNGDEGFAIRTSDAAGPRSAAILPDLATCEDCLAELFDPADRRYRYPFINCTHCGPRYSIIEELPYDRTRTAMRHFPMCPTCRAEYETPSDRRFHAEPNACPDCGPRLALWDRAGGPLARDDAALRAGAAALRRGEIVAVKGIGGFHLLVDARDEASVTRLRRRKGREEKPFAVMFPALDRLRDCAEVSAAEAALLLGPARPIVLLRARGSMLAPAVAPRNPRIGAFLPYAPLHHLLLHDLGFPVVATSGNRSDEPIVIDENEAPARLAGIADLFLMHDRPILRPVDDSVAQFVCGRPQLLRRGRGHAPAPIAVEGVKGGILALGGHLKTTIALTQPGEVVPSPHIGDLDTVTARAAHARTIVDLTRLLATDASLVACDHHPDYASTQAAQAMALPVIRVQHHLAHIAACMAEHRLAPPLLGIAWDGTGWGPDGTVWGGEFLLVGKDGWRRVAHLRRFRLPGGEIAVREPRRAALGLLYEAFGEEALAMTDLAPVAAFAAAERAVLGRMLAQGINAPWCSSAGRLFDAFAALCGLRQRIAYEGQAASELEGAADNDTAGRSYEFPIGRPADGGALILDWQRALQTALAELRAGAAAGAVSAALHRGLAAAIVAIAREIGEPRVVLTGGCFQNARLLETAVALLREAGYRPFWPQLVPPNDGGIALGQAAWASWSAAAGGG